MYNNGIGTWEEAEEKVAGGNAGGKKSRGTGSFQSMGFSTELMQGITQSCGYTVPTPVQRRAIPPLMQGLDVVAMARTGSGKTAAYLLPLLHRLKEHSKIVGIRGLILSPTRELSLQILRMCSKLSRYTNLKASAIVGGKGIDEQFAAIATNPDIVVATPGRILHIMEESGLKLSLVEVIVMDEADRLFELGLQPQIIQLISKAPESCQRTLFSATMPSILAEFTNAGLHNPITIRLDAEMKLSDKLKESAFLVRSNEKIAALIYILKKIIGVKATDVLGRHDGHTALSMQKSKKRNGKIGNKRSRLNEDGNDSDNSEDYEQSSVKRVDCGPQALVFVESKHHVEFLEKILDNYNISNACIHGQLDQEARRVGVQRFTRKKASVMVVTDVAARGLDIPLLDNVVNFSFPFTPKLFVHRVGRVARAGRHGNAYSIMTFEDMAYYIDLMEFLEKPLQSAAPEDLSKHPEFHLDDGCYGRIPEHELQVELAYLNKLVVENVEIAALSKVANNSHKKYSKTKKRATHQSIQEAKEQELRFHGTPIHPMLLAKMDKRYIEADKEKAALRTFKSRESILDLIHGEKVFNYEKGETIHSIAATAAEEQEEREREALEGKDYRGKKDLNRKKGSNITKKPALELGATSVAKPSLTTSAPMSLAESLLAKARERRREQKEQITHKHLLMAAPGKLRSIDAAEDDDVDFLASAGISVKKGIFTNTAKMMNSGSVTPSHVVRATRAQQAASEAITSYKDQEFYMSDERVDSHEDAHYTVKGATFDITPETAEDARAQRSVFAWNKKKNRYVKMHVNDAKAMSKGMKNESGKAIDFKKKLDAYYKWMKKTNMRIQDVGEEEDLSSVTRARSAMEAGKFSSLDGGDAVVIGDDEDTVDISNPNAGKKLRIGKRKSKKYTKDGLSRDFDQMVEQKKRKELQARKEGRVPRGDAGRSGGGGGGRKARGMSGGRSQKSSGGSGHVKSKLGASGGARKAARKGMNNGGGKKKMGGRR